MKKATKALLLTTLISGTVSQGSVLAETTAAGVSDHGSTNSTVSTVEGTVDPNPQSTINASAADNSNAQTTVDASKTNTSSTQTTVGAGASNNPTPQTTVDASVTNNTNTQTTVNSSTANNTNTQTTGNSNTTNHSIMFNLNTKETFVDGALTPIETPAALLNDRLYVPVRFLSTYLGFTPNWDNTTRTITFDVKNVKVTLKPDTHEALINDQAAPFNTIAAIVNDHLLLSARKMSELVGVAINYDAVTSQVSISTEIKKELPKKQNAKPVAQFSTDKKVYRIGEPIKYIDLSYDPDGTGYYNSWSGRQDAFFTAGPKQVTLSVKDPDGLVSEPFTQTIQISNEVLATEDEYPFYFGSMDDDPNRIPLNYGVYSAYSTINKKDLGQDTSRKLVLSDSPEQIKEYGILYQEKVKGKARLYGTHENAMTDKMVQVSVVVTNPTTQPITLRTTHQGFAIPSSIPEQQGQQALADWYLRGEQVKEQTIAPGQSIVFYRTGALFPKQGTNFMYDIETDGEAQVSFIANDPDEDVLKAKSLKTLPKGGNVRGTFDVSAFNWEVDGSGLGGKPGRLVIGDTVQKQWVQGRDGVTGEVTENKGNYGVAYNIDIKKPGKAAFALVPRGGAFKGTVLFNDAILPLPESGVVFAFQGYLIGRTTGTEDSVKLQVIPPSGSSLPFDILIYPLDNRK